MSREVMQQALEALEAKTHPVRVADEGRDYKRTMAAITALRAALAEPEHEPVAWWNGRETVWMEHELMGTNPPIENPIPLYTAPTPRKPLTDEEIDDLWLSPPEEVRNVRFRHTKFARAIERAHGIGEQA